MPTRVNKRSKPLTTWSSASTTSISCPAATGGFDTVSGARLPRFTVAGLFLGVTDNHTPHGDGLNVRSGTGDGATAGRLRHPPETGNGTDPPHRRRVADPAQPRRFAAGTRSAVARLSPQPGDVAAQRPQARHPGKGGRRDGGADDVQRHAPAGSHQPAPRRDGDLVAPGSA